MSGNSIGKLFTLTSFGESHGPAIGGVVDGCPPGLSLSEKDLQSELDRRKPGTSAMTSQRREEDTVKILSGVFKGVTLGTPIAFIIENTEQRDSDYENIKDKFRPGHADLTYQLKYGLRDYRGGGRASARETAVRVAAGAIAKKYLMLHSDVKIIGYLQQMGDIKMELFDESIINTNPFFCADVSKLKVLTNTIKQIRKDGDSIGARLGIVVENMPVALGEPVYDRLDADLAAALMSMNAVKAVDVGDGFDVVTQKGSEHRDETTPDGFLSNHAGGILGGISTGQALRMSMALKPASSIRIPGQTLTTKGEATDIVTTGRHDPCVGLRAVPIAEAMVALVLMDHLLRDRAQNANVSRDQLFKEETV